MSVTIEHAMRDDGPAITRLIEDSKLPIDGLTDHLATTLVARHDGRVVGSAALELYREGALLRSVAVESAMRGRGVGHQLTEAALDLARDRGAVAVYLLTTTAEDFFPKFAFATIPRETVPASVQESIEFKSACPASAIVMRRGL